MPVLAGEKQRPEIPSYNYLDSIGILFFVFSEIEWIPNLIWNH